RSERWTTRVATHSHCHVRSELAHEPTRLHHAAQQPQWQPDVLPQGTALETTDRQAFDLVTGGRHLLHFHLSFRTNEQKFSVGFALFDGISDRYRWEDVPTGAATRDHDPKRSRRLLHPALKCVDVVPFSSPAHRHHRRFGLR